MKTTQRGWSSVRRQLLDRDLEAVEPALQGQVLEIGAHRNGRRGNFEPPLHQVKAWITLDRETTGRPHLRGEATCLPFPDATFDTVVCLEVLEYVRRPSRALKEMARVLRPKGTLVLTTPFLHRMDGPEDRWRFSEVGLRQLVGEAGFVVREIRRQGAALAVIANILRFVALRGRFRDRLAALPTPILLRFDSRAARSLPALATFTTGYLVHAQRREDPS